MCRLQMKLMEDAARADPRILGSLRLETRSRKALEKRSSLFFQLLF